MKLLPHATYHAKAELLNQIENRQPWSQDQMVARAAFLLKDPTRPDDIANYRVLTVLPVIYRLWAKIRSRQLDG